LVPLEDWRALINKGTNVLVTGPPAALTAFVEAARAELGQPIVSVGPLDPLRIDGARALILSDVDALSSARQQQLKQWMNEPGNGHVQILSLTTVPLFPLMQAHLFDAELYYRLNTIHLEISDV